MSNPNTHTYAPVAVPVTESEEHAELGERFVAVFADTSSSTAEPYLKVIAPATLPEGYSFEVEVKGRPFTVKVPDGGVEEGQIFNVSAIPRTYVPVGHWKDGLFDCCVLGCVHPVLCNAICCPLGLLGQVMTRFRLTWLGNEGSPSQVASTFCIMLGINIFYQVVDGILKFARDASVDEYDEPTDASASLLYVRWICIATMCVFSTFVVYKARKHIRKKYNIPEQSCHGCEDCCCACWCDVCTIAQMARHTAEYETYPGFCCSATGMPPHAPSIV